MPKKPPTLAKLSRPRLYKSVVRERLLSLLDEKREHPVVWIAAPPGAGKTTLAASYIEEARAKSIWFQVDSGDSDPATFFYYLKQAVEQGNQRKAKPLQLFTPDYLLDIEGFSRRFFRDAFLRLPDDVLLVFDNYHEIEPQSPLHAGFAAALSEIPHNANVLVLSRADPPASFAQAIVNRTITTVPWGDLKLSKNEAADIAKARGVTDPAIIDELQLQSDGWVAGLTLMLERSIGGGDILGAARPETLETVSDYFAQVIFERSSSEAQDVMLRTAMLPHITPALVEAVTGNNAAIDHIKALHRGHLFVGRTHGEVETYQYHKMFHGYLKSRARIALTSDDIRTIQTKAAQHLEDNNDLEAAFTMCAGAHAWDDAVRLFIDHAPELIAHGRWRTLQRWFTTLPKASTDSNPWIQYWHGKSLIWVEPQAAQPLLKAAYEGFIDARLQTEQVLAGVGVLEAIILEYDYLKFHEIDDWLEKVSAHIEKGVAFSTAEDEIRVYSILVRCCYLRAPDHPSMQVWHSNLVEYVQRTRDPNLMVTVASGLLALVYLKGDESALEHAKRLAAPALHSTEVTPRNLGFYLADLGYALYTFRRYTEALDCYDRADDIANEYGLISVLQRTAYQRTICARRAGLHDVAEQSAESFASLRTNGNVAGPRSLEVLRAMIAFDRRDYTKAIESAIAVEDEIRFEGCYFTTMLHRIVCANILIGSGETEEAKRLLKLARSRVAGPNTDHHLGSIALNESWIAHINGNATSRDAYLEEALQWAHDKRGRLRYHWFRNALEALLPVALERKIDQKMALDLAHDLHITPGDNTTENWPWPVKIYTFGKFELLIDGQPAIFSRKLPKKTLALLKAIIALGGKDVPEQRLIDALWPDADGDSAQRSLSASLHRLRKLLVHADAVRLSGGALSLSEQLCWVDAFAFERQIACDGDSDAFGRALALYRGTFLIDEDSSPWLAPFREHLRSRFTDAVGKLGKTLEDNGRDDEAIALYSRGIEADNLIESFYQGLMRCHERLGQEAEAINTYRRLRNILSITLGVEPSTRSRQLISAVGQVQKVPLSQ